MPSPKKMVVKFCRECTGKHLELCSSPDCILLPIRTKKVSEDKILDRIKKYCLRCVGKKKNEVEKCSDKGCFLYSFRI